MGALIYLILVPSLLGSARSSEQVEFFVKLVPMPQEVQDFKIESARLEGMRFIDVAGGKRQQPPLDRLEPQTTTRPTRAGD